MSNSKIIECPHFSNSIDVDDLLYHQLEKKAKQESAEHFAKLKNELAAQKDELEQNKEQLTLQFT